ncbi:MAG: hypothetical protein IT314_12395 [Anaerolineales bacterium]|nr:hypothetical protein [Anaerolineales bacterium]
MTITLSLDEKTTVSELRGFVHTPYNFAASFVSKAEGDSHFQVTVT